MTGRKSYIVISFLLLSVNVQANVNQCPQNNKSDLSNQVLGLLKTNLLAFNGLQLKVEGPNCWNAALISTGILKSIRPVTKPEFWFWMNSKYCQAIPSSEKPKTGDIGSLFWKHWGNYHSFMRIDDNTVFSKNGPDVSDKYEVQSYEDMFYENYKSMAKTCKGSESNLRNNGCEFQIVYHRCQQLEDDFFSRVKEIRGIAVDVDGIESNLSKWMLDPAVMSENEASVAMEKLGIHLTTIRSQSLEGEKEFARKALEYRIIALLQTGLNSVKYTPSKKASEAINQAYKIQTEERSHIPDEPSKIQRSK